jgi:hypothetical protein
MELIELHLALKNHYGRHHGHFFVKNAFQLCGRRYETKKTANGMILIPIDGKLKNLRADSLQCHRSYDHTTKIEEHFVIVIFGCSCEICDQNASLFVGCWFLSFHVQLLLNHLLRTWMYKYY